MCISSCIETPNSFTHLPPGKWRGILKLTDPDAQKLNTSINETEKVIDYFELPFNFEVTYDDEQMHIDLINGDEKIRVEDIHLGRDKATAMDTILFDFISFDTRMEGFYEENFIEGYWKVPYKGKYSIQFFAKYGEDYRFYKNPTDSYNFEGDWAVTFDFDNPDSAYKAIGEFKQNGSTLNGTFRTETGDYRYLAGDAKGNKMKLSVFDGSHAFLFSGNFKNDTIVGEFRSGSHYKTKWKAHRLNKDDEDFLKDPYDMTGAVTDQAVNFSFPDIDGNMISINDKRFDNKIALINIMGTWCPNCKDEILFLKEIKEEYPQVEIISIAFERYREKDKAIEILKKYQNKMDFDWPIILGGYADKSETSALLPFIDKIYSYPTLITLNKDKTIIEIHTGFNGPATTKYKAFETEFKNKIKSLIN